MCILCWIIYGTKIQEINSATIAMHFNKNQMVKYFCTIFSIVNSLKFHFVTKKIDYYIFICFTLNYCKAKEFSLVCCPPPPPLISLFLLTMLTLSMKQSTHMLKISVNCLFLPFIKFKTQLIDNFIFCDDEAFH